MNYDDVHFNRALFLVKVKQWFRASMTMCLMGFYDMLWTFTIVGGIIKRYSYFMVPYIVAENPGIKPNDAITLSRKMMNGHKWECFKFEMSFLGWTILGMLTFSLSEIFYSNPYKIAAFTEYYAELRRLAKENQIPNADLLNDTYLFEVPEEAVLKQAYEDVLKMREETFEIQGEISKVRRFFAVVFGITFGNSEMERNFEAYQSRKIRSYYARKEQDGQSYPTRLSAIPEQQKRSWAGSLNCTRCYSVWSIVWIFFAMSFVGWIWEVSIHLVADGVFVNRGVLHGPWLPIYGMGSVLILVLLNKFRKNPALEFVMAIVLCGCVEYFTAFFLETTHGGTKWWDYSGYFLNLHGRICAEGLLVFGVGGMAIVYFLAPFLDGIFRRIPYKKLAITGAVLLFVFMADSIYSSKHPNVGKGITDYESGSVRNEKQVVLGYMPQEYIG